MKVTCPTTVHPNDDPDDPLVGCGHEFEAEPDRDGLVDCPYCFIWFDPEKEAETLKLLEAIAWIQIV